MVARYWPAGQLAQAPPLPIRIVALEQYADALLRLVISAVDRL
jgi:hypothetical protein